MLLIRRARSVFGITLSISTLTYTSWRSCKCFCQPFQRHVLRDHMVRNKEILPRLAVVGGTVVTCTLTPKHCCITFREHFGICHFVTSFGLKHVNRVFCFSNEVRLVLGIFCTPLVVDLELTFGRLEPLQ